MGLAQPVSKLLPGKALLSSNSFSTVLYQTAIPLTLLAQYFPDKTSTTAESKISNTSLIILITSCRSWNREGFRGMTYVCFPLLFLVEADTYKTTYLGSYDDNWTGGVGYCAAFRGAME
jgi:hypothetical protein